MNLPDCMMPDGAEPCAGYSQLLEEREALRTERLDLQIKNNGLQQHIGTLERRLEALHERFNLSPSASTDLPR